MDTSSPDKHKVRRENLERLKQDPVFEAKRLAGIHRRWLDPKFREKVTEREATRMRAKNASPAYVAYRNSRTSEEAKKRMNQPEIKEKSSAIMKRLRQDPAFIAKMETARLAAIRKKYFEIPKDLKSKYHRVRKEFGVKTAREMVLIIIKEREEQEKLKV
jgi:hypothetical protein